MNNKIITTMFALTLIAVSAPGVARADGLILRGA